MTFAQKPWTAAIAALLLALVCIGATHVTVTPRLDSQTATAGQTVSLNVDVAIQEGFHAQSHTPKDPSYIPLTLKLDAQPAVAFGPILYPPAKDIAYPNLGVLSVYTGRFTLKAPVTVAASATAGPVHITGAVRLQICTDSTCLQPASLPFEAMLTVEGAGAAALPPATSAVTAPGNQMPATAPATSSSAAAMPPSPPGPAKLFGLELDRDSYFLAFAGAFLAGIIFNAMPCVLPVVPLKIMGFYEAAHHSRARSISLAAVFSLGLIASFGVLGLLIIPLHQINWGGLFQHLWFTILIVAILLALALNLFGFFTINLPPAINQFSPRHDTYIGNFMFGILTAALSTPCTFGVFGLLLTWALSQSAVIGVSILIVVGAGMASPYFVLSAFPEIARKFPRTGPWSQVMKQSLAFLLLATAVYFAQPLLSRVAPARYIWFLILAVVLAGGAFVIIRTLQIARTISTRMVVSLSVAIVEVTATVLTVQLTRQPPYHWVDFSNQAFIQARASGKPVLVDFTASWCGNCHWIEATVLNNPNVIAAVRDNQVIMLKADVTDDSAAGKPLLINLNPAGAIPLTAVYAPQTNQPQLLDGIYSAGDLIRTIQTQSKP